MRYLLAAALFTCGFSVSSAQAPAPENGKGPAFSAKSPVPSYFSPEKNLGRHYLYADGGFHADWYVGYNNCWIIKLPPVPTGGYAKAFIGAKLAAPR